MHSVDPSIFKAYDIRGKYPSQLDEDLSYRIGRAYATLLQQENIGKKLNIVVSGDMRLSTPELKPKLIQGLIDSGCNVIDIGLSTTPTFYFAVAYYGYDGGVQVSASHNPKEYNGFKMVRARAVPISGDSGILTIRDMAIANDFKLASEPGSIDYRSNIVHELVKVEREGLDWQTIKPFKIVVDAANSMGALDIEAMFKDLPCEIIELNFTLDGSFPAHEPDPLKPANLVPLQKAVLSHQADLGIAPDGDGDRYFFIDEKGQNIRQEVLRGIIAQSVLKDLPNSKIAYDIRPGKITRDMIIEKGGIPTVTRVGHSLIKEQMLKENAVYGGESSGHYFFRQDYGTFEMPTILTLRFLIWVSQLTEPLSKAIQKYYRYYHSGEINSEVHDKSSKMSELAEIYSAGEVSWLDGVTVEFPDYWFNVRPSNTESLLRLNLEAVSQTLMEQKRDEILAIIRA